VADYLALGALCVFYWLFIERTLLQLLFQLRRSKAALEREEAPSGAKLFVGGAVSVIILLLWPVYVVVALSRIGLVVGGTLKPSRHLV
jgi:hypothetical protein